MYDFNKPPSTSRPLPPMSPYPKPVAPVDSNVPQGKDLFNYVLDRMDEDESRATICSTLVAFGYSEMDSAKIVADIAKRRRFHIMSLPPPPGVNRSSGAGKTNMILGGFVFVAGLTITIGTALTAPTGGASIIAYGALFWGIIQFSRGYAQSKANDS